jgi:tetratricopeptide (TPR) repeat protein
MKSRWWLPIALVLWLGANAALAWVGVIRLAPGDRPTSDSAKFSVPRYVFGGVERKERAVADNPLSADAHYELGHAYADAEEYEKAVEAFKQAVLLETDYVEAYAAMGYAYCGLGYWQEAEAALRRALDFEPDYVYSHLDLGWALEEQGRLGEAADVYREAIRLAPGYADVQEWLVHMLLDAGKLTEAAAALGTAPALSTETRTRLHWELHSALAGQGRVGEAARALANGVEAMPDNVDLRFELAKAYWYLGERDKALAQAEIVAGLDPEAGAALRGWLEEMPATEKSIRGES